MTPDVIVERVQAAGRIMLNRPGALHALTEDMCQTVYDALKAWDADPGVKLVMIEHAAGTRGFCAGGDIRMLAESGAEDGRAARSFFRTEYRLNALIKRYSKPYVAFMDGVTMGGGVGVSVHGSHRIATERTVFAMPETAIGHFPDVGGGWFLPRLPKGWGFGAWLGLTGERLMGADVLAAGVATHFVASADLEPLKQSLLQGSLDPLDAAQQTAAGSFEPHLGEMASCFEQDSVERILGALQANGSDWAKRQIAVLQTKCPWALKVTYRLLAEGVHSRKFEDNMRTEFRLASRVVHRHDFQEGVRAVVIDKDNCPVWRPDAIGDVGGDVVDAAFASLGAEELTFELES